MTVPDIYIAKIPDFYPRAQAAAAQAAGLVVITQPHCQSCGSTDYEDVSLGDQGYSACCNEIVIWGGSCADGHCYHGGWGQ